MSSIRSAIVLSAALLAAASSSSAQPAQPAQPAAPAIKAGSQTFNTIITKLKEGKQVFSLSLIHI